MPVVVVNDDRSTDVTSVNAERTTSGTTALITVPATPKATWITMINLSLAEAQLGV